jgi:predicted chitinase
VLSAGWFWDKHHLNQLADAEMYQALTKRINAKLDGFPGREAKRKAALNVLCHAAMLNLASSAAHLGARWL